MTSTIDSVALFRTLEQALRAGFGLRQALERAANDFDSPDMKQVAEAAVSGARLETIFDRWAASSADIGLLAGAIRLQLETEGNLADTLGVLHSVLARRPTPGLA